MPKFKAGERVTYRGGGNFTLVKGENYIVSFVDHHSGKIKLKNAYYPAFFYPPDYFDPYVDPIDKAKALLEKEGYAITPPKPKLTGKIAVRRNKDDGTVAFVEQDESYLNTFWDTIAVVDWTEGQGL